MTPLSQIQGGARGDSLRASMDTAMRGKDESAAIQEVSRQFEAILVRQILNTAHVGAAFGPEEGSSTTSEVYRDLLTSQLADQISKSGDLGMARQMEGQLSRQVPGGGTSVHGKPLEPVWTD
jgi:Rod binding domain-containing protein